MAPTEVIHAYRNLYRNLLKAVQYTVPARFVARDQIRRAFREPGATYDERGIKRTIWFFKAAAKEKGMEHKILKNLVRVQQMRFRKKDYSAYDPLKHAE
ncbi:complex 1 protein [Fusarium heterosporum]|uniref:Complex 1 protein n=1 Tax=Fusarium heterosporum TaxID=42747 RepID=A0A8H5T5I2_FUSHE|nr:complex 1 protein [Fusarium heterosporum]